MSKCLSMKCYFCSGEVSQAEHIALDEEGEVVCMCNDCYKLAEKFFVRGGNKNES